MKTTILLLPLFLLVSVVTLAQNNTSAFDSLKFRFIGPEGNRAIAIAGVPGDPMINYIGAASGGLMEDNGWRN